MSRAATARSVIYADQALGELDATENTGHKEDESKVPAYLTLINESEIEVC